MPRKQKAPPAPISVDELIGVALCRLTDPHEEVSPGRRLWQTKQRDIARLKAAFTDAAPEEWAALVRRIEGP